MVVICQTCEKPFANKRSLASHNSRIHSKMMREETHQNSNISEDESDSGTTSNPQSNSDSENVENGDFSASGSGESDTDSDGKELESNSEVSDSDSDFESNERKRRQNSSLFGRKNKKLKYTSPEDDKTSKRMVKVLKSLDKRLKNSICKDDKCTVDYLLAYGLKNSVFHHIEELVRGHGKELDALLTMDERALLDAVLATPNLTDVHKLLNENGEMVSNIAKLYMEHAQPQTKEK